MATLYAKTAGGNWSAAGTWSTTGSGGGDSSGPPTAADNVIFETGSGNVTINSTAVCRSLDCTSGTGNYGGVLTHNASVGLSIGDATAGAGNVALKLVAGMTYSLGSATTSALSFISTSTTQQTITSGGKTVGNFTINGLGSSYLLSGAMTSSGLVTLTKGTFDTGGVACSWVAFNSSGSLARTLTLGASAITVPSATGWNTSTITNLTMSANTAVVTLSGTSSVTLSLGPIDYNGLSITVSGGAIVSVAGSGTATLANLTYVGTAIKTGEFNLGLSFNVTVTSTFTVTGASAVNRVLIGAASDSMSSAHTITAAIVSLANVDFMAITGAGAASPFTGTSLGDCLGNSGITFDAPVTQTHTASAGGSWSDITKWTSRVPLPQDNVIVDVGTTGTLTADMPRLGANMTFTGFAGTLGLGAGTVTIFGSSVVLGSGMTLTGAGTVVLAPRSASTITSNARTWPGSLTLRASNSAAFTLSDALAVTSVLAFNPYTNSAPFNTANFSVSCGIFEYFSANGSAGTVELGTSTVTLTSTANGGSATSIWSMPSGSLNASLATIVIGSASASSRTFKGGNKTYGTLTYTLAGSTGSLVMTGANVFSTLNFSDASNARTLTLPANTTIQVDVLFNVRGSSAGLMTINSSTSGTKATLFKAYGVVSCDYLSIKDSAATGGASWYAGANSTSVSNNTGWFFTVPTNLVNFFDFI